MSKNNHEINQKSIKITIADVPSLLIKRSSLVGPNLYQKKTKKLSAVDEKDPSSFSYNKNGI